MKVTSALRAKTLPLTVMPLVSVIWVRARIVPTNVLPEFFRNAELPTCQKTLHAWAPFVRVTDEVGSTVRSLPAWKMKTEFGLPFPSSVSGTGPLTRMLEVEL